MIKVLIHSPGRHDATCWYRASSPFAALRKETGGDIEYEFNHEFSFSMAKKYDMAFFQRPSSTGELEAIQIFKRLGIPVIVDFDDLLFEVPTDNPAYFSYMNKATQETIAQIIMAATVVWVSTPELKRCFQLPNSILNEKVYVIPNALDDMHLVTGARSHPPSHRQNMVLWRGSATHTRDLLTYTPEIAEIARQHPSTKFVFAGWNPWFLTEDMKPDQSIVSGLLAVGEFMEFIYGVAPAMGIVPLHDSRFNRCKSNIAWLEMTWSGATVLAPDWEEWRKPGVINYTHENISEKLHDLLSMSNEDRAKNNTLSWNHIKENFMLSKVNHTRFDTIMAALNRKPLLEWPKGYEHLPDPDVEKLMELG